MPRLLGIENFGGTCHVTNGEDRCEPNYKNDADHTRLLQTLGEARQPARSEPVSKVRSDPFTWNSTQIELSQRRGSVNNCYRDLIVLRVSFLFFVSGDQSSYTKSDGSQMS